MHRIEVFSPALNSPDSSRRRSFDFNSDWIERGDYKLITKAQPKIDIGRDSLRRRFAVDNL
jgi:hypothetical protein